MRYMQQPGTCLLSYEATRKSGIRSAQDLIGGSLSGIFASNAIGAVSFQVGSEVSQKKVFAMTEVSVLARNPRVDPLTKELLAYFQRCIHTRQTDIININVGFIAG